MDSIAFLRAQAHRLLNRQMQRPGARLLAGVAAVGAVLVLAASFFIPQMLDGSTQGRALAQQLARLTGQRIQIEGGVRVALWPSPHVAIGELRILSPDGRLTRAKATRVDLDVTLTSLLSRKFEIEQVHFYQPSVQWSAGTEAGAVLARLSPQLTALGVQDISWTEGTLTIARASQSETLSGLEGSFSVQDSNSQLQFDTQGDWRGAPARLHVDIGTPLAGTAALAQLELDVGAAELAARINGLLDVSQPHLPFDGQVMVSAGQASALWALASSLGLASAVPADQPLTRPLQFTAALKATAQDFSFSAIDLKLGELALGGLARWTGGKDGGISLALTTPRLDLGQWPSLLPLVRGGEVIIPRHWLAAFDLQAGQLQAGPLTASAVGLKGEIKNGTLTASAVRATLPGETRLTAKGLLATRDGAAATLDGTVTVESLQLRDLLGQSGFTLPASLEETALRQLKLSTDVRGTWGNLGFSNLEASLDTLTVTGQISPRRSDGLFGATLNVNNLNLAAYGAMGQVPTWLWQLPPLSVSVQFDRLSLGDAFAQNVALEAELKDRLLTLKSADAVDFGGNKIRLAGTLSAEAEQDADFTLRLITPDFARFSRDLPLTAPLLPATLASWLEGTTDLSVRWKRSSGETQQMSSVSFPAGRMDVVQTRRTQAPASWKARVQSRESATVLARLVPQALAQPTAILGPLDLYAEGSALDNNRWQIESIQGQVAGMTVRDGELVVAPGTAPRVDGRLLVRQANLGLWRQTLNLPALGQALSASVALSIDELALGGDLVTDAQVKLGLESDGGFELSGVQGRWRDGSVSGSLAGRIVAPYKLKGEISITETNVTLAGGDRYGVDGMLDFSLRAEGEGASWPDVLRNLQGDGEFALDSGTLQGIDFAELTRSLLDKDRSQEVTDLLAQAGNSPLSSFGGDFTIEDGVLAAPQLRLRTPAASAELKATVDLPSRRTDAVATVSLRELASLPPFTLQLSGQPQALEGRFDTAALAAKLGAPSVQAASVAKTDTPAAATEVEDGTLAMRQPQLPQPPDLAAKEAEKATAAVKPDVAPKRGTVVPSRAAAVARATETDKAVASARRVPRPDAMEEADRTDRPPSISALLEVMPAMQDAVNKAMAEERRVSRIAPAAGGAIPSIEFTPAPMNGSAQPAGGPRLAPEFSQPPTPSRDAPTLYSVPSGPDIVVPDDDGAPPPSMDDLLQRVKPRN